MEGCRHSSTQSKAEAEAETETMQTCLEAEMSGTARTLLVKAWCLLALYTS